MKLEGQLGLFREDGADDKTRFSPEAAETAKEQGMFAATLSRGQILQAARELAVQLALRAPDGTVNIDDVIAVLLQWGHHPSVLGNAAGSVFLPSQWVCVSIVPSSRVSNHGRMVRNWKLRSSGAEPSRWIPVGRKVRGDQ